MPAGRRKMPRALNLFASAFSCPKSKLKSSPLREFSPCFRDWKSVWTERVIFFDNCKKKFICKARWSCDMYHTVISWQAVLVSFQTQVLDAVVPWKCASEVKDQNSSNAWNNNGDHCASAWLDCTQNQMHKRISFQARLIHTGCVHALRYVESRACSVTRNSLLPTNDTYTTSDSAWLLNLTGHSIHTDDWSPANQGVTPLFQPQTTGPPPRLTFVPLPTGFFSFCVVMLISRLDSGSSESTVLSQDHTSDSQLLVSKCSLHC